MIATRTQDRGLLAVARVREMRERDSRLGLLASVGAVREREAKVVLLRRALREAMACSSGTLDEFAQHRSMLALMATSLREAEAGVDSARRVAEEAHRRWQGDKANLKAIQHLCDERARQRAEAADRAEQRELDDIVGALFGTRASALRPAVTASTASTSQPVTAGSGAPR